jgi:1,2-diacylglycerol 3-beta-glucosyltransferase
VKLPDRRRRRSTPRATSPTEATRPLMTSRLIAGSILAVAVGLAWMAVTWVPVARGLQLIIVLSVGYTAYVGWRGWRVMRRVRKEAGSGAGEPTGDARGLPTVSLVVPAKDEAGVIVQISRDLAAQRYHRSSEPHFEVIVVDDGSSDGTGQAAREVALEHGHFRVVRRDPGSGPATRGAALNHATTVARGEVIGAVDADARVDAAFLERVMKAWRRDPGAVAIQAQKRPTNPDRSWITAVHGDELLLDMASQCGRWVTGGAAELRGNGMFVQRKVLERLGGWGEEVLTEDLDMSTRLAVAGEWVALAPEATVGEEAVDVPRMMWPQRMRWAEGSLRRLLEHGPVLLRSRVPLSRKLDTLAWSAEFVVPPLFVAGLAASLVTVIRPGPADWTLPISIVAGYGLGTFSLALSGLAGDGRKGLRLLGGALRAALFLSLWLAVVPVALLRIAFGSGRIRYVKTPRLTQTESEGLPDR